MKKIWPFKHNISTNTVERRNKRNKKGCLVKLNVIVCRQKSNLTNAALGRQPSRMMSCLTLYDVSIWQSVLIRNIVIPAVRNKLQLMSNRLDNHPEGSTSCALKIPGNLIIKPIFSREWWISCLHCLFFPCLLINLIIRILHCLI